LNPISLQLSGRSMRGQLLAGPIGWIILGASQLLLCLSSI
jgi:hypothetical protein